MTFASLANNTGRKGASLDLATINTTMPGWARLELFFQLAVAPTAGNLILVYWASSYDNTNWDGNLANADGAASDTDVHQQLLFVGALPVDNVTTRQQMSWLFRVPARYGFPVIYNTSGQAFTATEANHGINLTPLIDQYQTT